MPRGLHLRLEGFRGDEDAEMRLFGHAALHCLVVRVHAGVVVDFEGRRMQGCGDLYADLVSTGAEWEVDVKVGVP